MNRPDTPGTAMDVEQILCRALVTAHLITGHPGHAEEAVLKGIETWNPNEELEGQMLCNVIEAAIHAETPSEPDEPIVPALHLGDELKAVLRLDQRRRKCFVLRNLVGLTSADSARLLRMLPSEIDECNVAALQSLAAS